MALNEINKSEIQRLIKKADREYKNGQGIIKIETSNQMLYYLKRILAFEKTAYDCSPIMHQANIERFGYCSICDKSRS